MCLDSNVPEQNFILLTDEINLTLFQYPLCLSCYHAKIIPERENSTQATPCGLACMTHARI
jgi:hypothetical protein